MLTKNQRFIKNLNFPYTESPLRGEVNEVAFISGAGFNTWFYYNFYTTNPPEADGINVLLGKFSDPNSDGTSGGRWIKADSDVAERLFPEWESDKDYASNDRVQTADGVRLVCVVDHTSGTILDDTDLLNWVLFNRRGDSYTVKFESGHYYPEGTNLDIAGKDSAATHEPTVLGEAPITADWNVIISLGYSIFINDIYYNENITVDDTDSKYASFRAFFEEGDVITIRESAEGESAIAGIQELGISDWEPNKGYTLHQGIYHQGRLLRATSSRVTSAVFDSAEESNWEVIDVGNVTTLKDWEAGKSYIKDVPVVIGGGIYRSRSTHESGPVMNLTELAKWQLLIKHAAVINDWRGNANYQAREVVYRNGKVLRSLSDRQSLANWGTLEAVNWETISDHDLILGDWLPSTAYREKQIIRGIDGKVYRCRVTHTSDSASFPVDVSNWDVLINTGIIFKGWQADTLYDANEIVVKDKEIYRSNSTRQSRPDWDDDEIAAWSKLTVRSGFIRDWQANTTYEPNECIRKDGLIYTTDTGLTSDAVWNDVEEARWLPIGGGVDKGALVFDWSAGLDVLEDQVVYVGGAMYRSLSERTTGANWDVSEQSNWEVLAGGNAYVPDWESGLRIYEDQVFFMDNVIFRAPSTLTTGVAWDDTERARYEALTVDINTLNSFSINTSSALVLDATNVGDRSYNRADSTVEIDTDVAGLKIGDFWNVVNYSTTEIEINTNSHVVNTAFAEYKFIPQGGVATIVITSIAGSILSLDILGTVK